MANKRSKQKPKKPSAERVFRLYTITKDEQEKVAENFVERSRQAQTYFEQTFPELQQELLNTDPLFFLAYFARRLFIPVGETPESQNDYVSQHEIELFQALALRNTLNSYKREMVALEQLETFHHKLSSVARAFPTAVGRRSRRRRTRGPHDSLSAHQHSREYPDSAQLGLRSSSEANSYRPFCAARG